MDVLLAAGADVHVRDNVGRQPIHEAVHDGPIVRALIAHGADPNDTGTARHPVFAPITTAAPDATRALLGAGAQVDAVGPSGWTVAGNAASSGDMALLQQAIALGAPTGATGAEGASALRHAACSGRAQIVAWLIEHGHGDVDDGHVRRHGASDVTALMAPASAGSLETVDVLLAYGAGVHARDSIGRTSPWAAGCPATRTSASWRARSRARDPCYAAVKILLAAERAPGLSAAREAELRPPATEHRPPG